MAGDQNTNIIRAPLPTSPSGLENVTMHLNFTNSHQHQSVEFDQKTIEQLEQIVSMEENNIDHQFPEVEVKIELDQMPSCSGGTANMTGQLPPLDYSYLSKPDNGFSSTATPFSTSETGQFSGSSDDGKSELDWPVPAKKAKFKAPSGRKALKDEDKRERRKAQNRQAAKNYREKQKSRKERVESDYTELIAERSTIEKTIADLRQELANLQDILTAHQNSGKCQMLLPPSMAISQTAPCVKKEENCSGIPERIPPMSLPNDDLNTEQMPAPPITPMSNQSFGFDRNLYSPGNDVADKYGGPNRVLSPLQHVLSPPQDEFIVGVGVSDTKENDFNNFIAPSSGIDMDSWASSFGVWNELNGGSNFL